jgi:pyrimidine-nucleoside phosphorylase
MVVLAKKAASLAEAKNKLKNALSTGRALEKFKSFVSNQGGDPSIVDHPDKLPQADYRIEVPAKSSGVVSGMIADEIGVAAMMLGAGRATKEDQIDFAVGIVLHKKVGDRIERGESLATIYADRKDVEEVKDKLYHSISISDHGQAPKLIHTIITE